MLDSCVFYHKKKRLKEKNKIDTCVTIMLNTKLKTVSVLCSRISFCEVSRLGKSINKTSLTAQ